MTNVEYSLLALDYNDKKVIKKLMINHYRIKETLSNYTRLDICMDIEKAVSEALLNEREKNVCLFVLQGFDIKETSDELNNNIRNTYRYFDSAVNKITIYLGE